MTQQELLDLLNELGLEGLVTRNNNIQACCPFHQENNPSWGIRTDAPHIHGCFSCGAKGNLYTLLIHLGKSPAEASRISGQAEEGDLRLRDIHIIGAPTRPKEPAFDERETYHLSATIETFQYLQSRGIPVKVIRKAGCMYDREKQRVLFPWRHDGKLKGLTGRTVVNNKVKTLPYYGTKKGSLLYLPYGKITPASLVLVEGEIDALSCCTVGYSNVGALGFGKFSERQAEFVLHSPATQVVCFFDDDDTGRRLTRTAREYFEGKLMVRVASYREHRHHYHEKLDPAKLTRGHRKEILDKALKSVDFPLF